MGPGPEDLAFEDEGEGEVGGVWTGSCCCFGHLHDMGPVLRQNPKQTLRHLSTATVHHTPLPLPPLPRPRPRRPSPLDPNLQRPRALHPPLRSRQHHPPLHHHLSQHQSRSTKHHIPLHSHLHPLQRFLPRRRNRGRLQRNIHCYPGAKHYCFIEFS